MTIDTKLTKLRSHFHSRAYKAYSAYPLSYHNWEHIRLMINELAIFGSSYLVDDDVELVLAILYHDIVYVPGAGAIPGWNETQSARLFLADFDAYDGPDKDRVNPENVARLIMATEVSNQVNPDYQPKTVNEARLMDLDLLTLALPYQAFSCDQQNLAVETGGRNLSRLARSTETASFLTRFLPPYRKSVYHTAEAELAWGNKARANIQHYLHAHGLDADTHGGQDYL